MKTKYKVDDIVYVVNDFRVVKSVIDSVNIRIDKNGEHVIYNVYEYKKQNSQRKVRQYEEAFLVDNLKIAKQSALTNWERITIQVEKDLNNLTDKMFEPEKNDS